MALNRSNYCPDCFTLIDTEQPGVSRCPQCGWSQAVRLGEVIAAASTNTLLLETKRWQEDLAKTQKEKFDELNIAGKVRKAECLEQCPQCDNDKLMFWTMQTRSADEGETVFYECAKCGYKRVDDGR